MTKTVFALAWRNSLRSMSRRWPVVVILAATVGVLEVGNTLFESSSKGLEKTYIQSFAAELSISAKSDEGFTLFGNELPLIGEYAVLPVLPDAGLWLKKVDRAGGKGLGQVSAGGVLSLGNWKTPVPLFGVNLKDYFAFFPDLKVVMGKIPDQDGHWLAMNEAQYQSVSKALGRAPVIGENFDLTVFNDHSFSIREVCLAAVYRYPVRDDMVDRIALVDADTARALNGYIYGAVEKQGSEATGTTSSDLDALFADASDQTKPQEKGLTTVSVESALADSSARKALNTTVADSWNFILVHPRAESIEDIRKTLDGDPGINFRDWRETVGGNALVTWFLQVLFNVGLMFITLGAVLVGMNGLALSVAERTRELGTLRALGATKGWVSGLVTVESMLIVAGAGFGGVILGIVVLILTSAFGVALTNPYLQALFGTEVLRPAVSWGQVGWSCVFSLVLGLVSISAPVHKVVKIPPVAAMATGG